MTLEIAATLHRIRAIARIETLFICGDRATLGLILVVPAIQIALFGYAVNFEPRDVPIAVAGAAAEPSGALSAAIDDTGYFRVVADGLPKGAAEQQVRLRRALIGVELSEPAAGEDAWSSAAGSPRLVVDTSEPSAVRPAVAALESAWLRRTLHATGLDLGHAVQVDWLYNPDGRTAWSLVPGLAGVVVMISALLLGALTLVRERERGTWEALLVTPVRPGEALLGKLAPYVLLGVLQGGVVVALGHALFDVPVRGSVALLLAASALFAAAHLTLRVRALRARGDTGAGRAGRRSLLPAVDGAVRLHVPVRGHAALGAGARRGTAADALRARRARRAAAWRR